MKEYKLVHLNEGLSWTIDSDLAKAENVINEYVAEGWELKEIVSPSGIKGYLVGVFYKEK